MVLRVEVRGQPVESVLALSPRHQTPVARFAINCLFPLSRLISLNSKAILYK